MEGFQGLPCPTWPHCTMSYSTARPPGHAGLESDIGGKHSLAVANMSSLSQNHNSAWCRTSIRLHSAPPPGPHCVFWSPCAPAVGPLPFTRRGRPSGSGRGCGTSPLYKTHPLKSLRKDGEKEDGPLWNGMCEFFKKYLKRHGNMLIVMSNLSGEATLVSYVRLSFLILTKKSYF